MKVLASYDRHAGRCSFYRIKERDTVASSCAPFFFTSKVST